MHELHRDGFDRRENLSRLKWCWRGTRGFDDRLDLETRASRISAGYTVKSGSIKRPKRKDSESQIGIQSLNFVTQ